jgi:hypothetical protein
LRANLPTPLRLDEEQAMGAVWQDVRTKAVERLAGRDRRFSHFMGALVLESRAKPSVKQVPSFQVVDGQQRLTTFQIFLTAARHYALKIGYATAASNIQRRSAAHGAAEVEVFKVWPTQGDREMFIDIVSSEDRETLRKKNGAYWYKNQERDQIEARSKAIATLARKVWSLPEARVD